MPGAILNDAGTSQTPATFCALAMRPSSHSIRNRRCVTPNFFAASAVPINFCTMLTSFPKGNSLSRMEKIVQVTATPKPLDRTLVIGSERHQHVTCVGWSSIDSVNVVDFDSVVIDVCSLTEDVATPFKPDYLRKTRHNLARLLDSGGRIVVAGVLRRDMKVSGGVSISNYEWCPLVINTVREGGDSIIARKADAFPKLHAEFKSWSFYYALAGQFLTPEIVRLCGGTPKVRYKWKADVFTENRYGSLLSGSYVVSHEASGEKKGSLGPITLLPHIASLEPRHAINLILEDLLLRPQATVPPSWVVGVSMPPIEPIQAAINAKEATIASIQIEIDSLASQKASLEHFKSLLYESGTELENVFEAALTRLGAKAAPARYSEEEFVFEYKGATYLVECKGVTKSISLTHVRQLQDYVLRYEEDEGKTGKGILFGNAWRDLPLEARGSVDTPFFPNNVGIRATQLSLSLLNSVDFYRAFCEFLSGRLSGEVILDCIVNAVGVAPFFGIVGTEI